MFANFPPRVTTRYVGNAYEKIFVHGVIKNSGKTEVFLCTFRSDIFFNNVLIVLLNFPCEKGGKEEEKSIKRENQTCCFSLILTVKLFNSFFFFIRIFMAIGSFFNGKLLT